MQVPGSAAGSPSVPPTRLTPAVVRAELDHGRGELVADLDRPLAWTLLVDGTAQSHVDLADPTHLEFEYLRRIAHLLDAVDPPPPDALAVLHLGGGAWTLPRFVAATRPRSRQRVVELDAALVELVRTRLPADGLDLDVRVGDARAGLAAVPDGAYDAVVLDVFAGARIPAHLTSVEFVRDVARALAPGGVYVANLADGAGGTGGASGLHAANLDGAGGAGGTGGASGLHAANLDGGGGAGGTGGADGAGRGLAFARGQAATAAAVFDEVAVVAAPDVLHGRRFGNLVLVAGRAGSLSGGALAEVARRVAGDPFPARVEPGRAFAGSAAAVTDATATPSPRPPVGFFGQ